MGLRYSQRVGASRVGSRPERTVGVQQLLCVERPLPQSRNVAVTLWNGGIQSLGHPCGSRPSLVLIRRSMVRQFRWHSSGDSNPTALHHIQKVAGAHAGNQSLESRAGESDIVRRVWSGPAVSCRTSLVPPVRPHDRREAAKETANNVNCGQSQERGGGICPAPEQNGTCGEMQRRAGVHRCPTSPIDYIRRYFRPGVVAVQYLSTKIPDDSCIFSESKYPRCLSLVFIESAISISSDLNPRKPPDSKMLSGPFFVSLHYDLMSV